MDEIEKLRRRELWKKTMDKLRPSMTNDEKSAWAKEAVTAGAAYSIPHAHEVMAISLNEHPGDCFIEGPDGKPVFEDPPILEPPK